MNDDRFDPDAPSDETWRSVRASLRDVVVPVEAREAAIASALAAFDELHSDSSTDHEAPVLVAAAVGGPDVPPISLADRRRRQQRWLGRAAAAVAVLAVGGVVVNGLRGSSDQEVSVEPASAMESSAKSTDSASADGGSSNDATSGGSTVESGSPEALAGATIAPMAAELETQPTIASIDVAAAPDVTAAPQGTEAPVPTESLADPAALADYAARTMAAPPMAGLPDSECVTAASTVIGVVSYQGTTAIVAIDPSGAYRAIALDTCAVLATVGP